MEELAVPENRLHEAYQDQDLEEDPNVIEISLVEHRQQILDGNWCWNDLVRLLGTDKVAWIAPNVFITAKEMFGELPFPYEARFHVDPWYGLDLAVINVCAPSWVESSPALEVLIQILLRTISVDCISVDAYGFDDPYPLPITPVTFERLIGQTDLSRSVIFSRIAFDEQQSSLLATAVCENIQLEFRVSCSFFDQGGALVEALQINQGPKKLVFWENNPFSAENFVAFGNALRVNTRLEELYIGWSSLSDSQVHLLVEALGENRGLISFALNGIPVNDTNWSVLVQSLRNNMSLQILNVNFIRMNQGERPTEEQRTMRTQQISQALQTNTVLQQILFHEDELDMVLFDREVEPRLRDNRDLLSRVQALVQEPSANLKACVLGRALSSSSERPAHLYSFLSSNPELLVQDDEAND